MIDKQADLLKYAIFVPCKVNGFNLIPQFVLDTFLM